MEKKRGNKRKRQEEDEPLEGLSCSTTTPMLKKKLTEEDEGGRGTEKEGIKKEKPKKEEGEHPVTTKKKKSKEEIEAAKALKIKKREEEQQCWRLWEEEKYEDGVKWKFLKYKDPFFTAEYQPLPDDVPFYYNGKAVMLSLAAEEVALFFAQMLDHEYTTKDVFRNNFFKDWKKMRREGGRDSLERLALETNFILFS
ncbi:hypothetical protein J4Q44_G00093870 [Coregonus suidteri]|uniref:DNA topoisomerase I DNA binding eukaryotic-type domain-containing protein n=1 Tax=Coregonus suidteri TaxID=861788 RepID=A0AAN8LX33_9TELE